MMHLLKLTALLVAASLMAAGCSDGYGQGGTDDTLTGLGEADDPLAGGAGDMGGGGDVAGSAF